MSARPLQMPLEFDCRPALGRADFLVAPSNAAAVDAISSWRDWPGQRMALTGPPRAGKTHLAHVWMRESNASHATAASLDDAAARKLAEAGAAVIEDVDQLDALDTGPRQNAEKALFHLMNLAANDGTYLLLTGRRAPSRWQVTLPDLASRLAALPVTALAEPDDMLLSSLMVKLFADRQLQVPPTVISYLVQRIDRSCAAAEAVVTALDRLSLARKKPVSRTMGAEVLDEQTRGARND